MLAAEADGRPLHFTNDLAVTKDGSKVYFTDASSKFGFGQSTDDIIEHGGHGRFLAYDFKTGKTNVLLKGLQFANGVALGPDEAFALVNETGSYQILRYWLKGEKLRDFGHLRGQPARIPRQHHLQRQGPFLGRDLRAAHADCGSPCALPGRAQDGDARAAFPAPPVKAQAYALAFDADGKLPANLQYDGGDAYSPVTWVREHPNGYLYFGSLTAESLGHIETPSLSADIGR